MKRIDEISLVPLDNRPFTFYTPTQISRIGGFQIRTPDPSLLGTYFTPGDRAAVATWWETAVRTTEASIVAVPMLAFGGLINSRYSAGISLEQALESLEILKTAKHQNPQHRIYAFDSIMRLTISPTREYPGNLSNKLREWSILKDKVEHREMADLRPALETVEAALPQELIDDYVYTRKRNLAINKRMIELVRDGFVDFLIIGQDDAEPYGLHRSERNMLMDDIVEHGLGDKVKIFPGADVIASLLVTKLAMESSGVSPKVYVEYSRKHGDRWIAPYQDIPYGQVIESYVSVLGGEMAASAENADLRLMANTAGNEPIDAFAERIAAFAAAGRPVAVGDDAYAGCADPVLIQALRDRLRFSDLAGYSGWNIGVSIAQSFARLAMLHTSREIPIERMLRSAESHQELLLEALAHEEGYRNHVRSEAVALARSHGDDPQRLQSHYQEINAFAVKHTEPFGDAWYRAHFDGHRVAIGKNGSTAIYGRIERLNGWKLQLPWNRTAEMEAFPEISIVAL